jgi:hypothetical protein
MVEESGAQYLGIVQKMQKREGVHWEFQCEILNELANLKLIERRLGTQS